MLKKVEMTEVIVAHREDETRAKVREVLDELGYHIRHECDSSKSLMDFGVVSPPDLIISGIELVDGAAIDALIAISHLDPTPAIVITPRDSLLDVEKALSDHVMAYLVEPVEPDQIKPTIYLVRERFRQFEQLKNENEDLRQALNDRKTIEKAKGILMGRDELTEEDAFRQLQKHAQSKRMKLAIYAAELLEQENGNA
ncbi:ANTAR domain-containing protein [Bremerella sp. JC817]|uniref:ANTAR domain-containing response regulator n=1 Tax=Bremerella sp. JC817 TaxID=3231756 RepID=UPI003457A419